MREREREGERGNEKCFMTRHLAKGSQDERERQGGRARAVVAYEKQLQNLRCQTTAADGEGSEERSRKEE